MQEFIKSSSSLMLALSLFGVKQIENIVTPRDRDEHHSPATKAMNSVTNATIDQFGETLRSTFRTLDNVQRGVVALSFQAFLPFLGRNREDQNEDRRRRRQSDKNHHSSNRVIRAEEALTQPVTRTHRD
jgi:hypothetical protein